MANLALHGRRFSRSTVRLTILAVRKIQFRHPVAANRFFKPNASLLAPTHLCESSLFSQVERERTTQLTVRDVSEILRRSFHKSQSTRKTPV